MGIEGEDVYVWRISLEKVEKRGEGRRRWDKGRCRSGRLDGLAGDRLALFGFGCHSS